MSSASILEFLILVFFRYKSWSILKSENILSNQFGDTQKVIWFLSNHGYTYHLSVFTNKTTGTCLFIHIVCITQCLAHCIGYH